MPDVILDIETVGLPWESFDESQQSSLLKRCESDEEREAAKGQLALWPLTGKVVAVGMMNVESRKRVVYFLGDGPDIKDELEGLSLFPKANERALLESTWACLAKYATVITFNGRGFDVPFLLTRSMICGVKVSRKDLLGPRFSAKPHCDLLEQLTFYGLMRKFSLDFWCKSLGVPSSKGGGDGSHVGELFREGRGVEIAEYCAGDVLATEGVYHFWAHVFSVR